MKKIFLIRHAKTSKSAASSKDFDRSLKVKGVAQSHWHRGFLTSSFFHLDAVYHSNARRTSQTAEIIFSQKNIPLNSIDYLYLGSDSDYQKLLQTLPNDENNIAIVGHNPGISDFAYYLTGEHINFNTAQCLIIDFPIEDWKGIVKDLGIIEQNFTPDVVDPIDD